MSSVKENAILTERLVQNEELNNLDNSLNINITNVIKNTRLQKDILEPFETDSNSDFPSGFNENISENSDVAKICVEKVLNKTGDHATLTKPEKRRCIALTKNEPPPLIHYLQDKEAPEIDDDNNPPQLLPEVIVTRTKLHKEKPQTSPDENSIKISVKKNLQKIKRKSWLKSQFSYNSSLSDDQASNESHEHFLPYADASQSSSSTSGALKRGLTMGSEKRKKSKKGNLREKAQGIGSSPDENLPLRKFSPCNGNGAFTSEIEQLEKCNGNTEVIGARSKQVEKNGKELSPDIRNEIDFESWMTETEDEEEDDIFVTPQRVSTGKEERDNIDGIEFLGFETEHDMVEFTKIEIDFQGSNNSEEKATHSDDGLDMMDDSFTYSESEAQTTSQAIIPTKTKDITKIKGWRTKNFAVNNNPSDGQGSSSSILSYEDDDGFVSCDVKIGEDVSLDMEEHVDLWTERDQNLFVHDDQFALDNYPLEAINKEIEGNTVLNSSNKSNVMESIETFSGFYDKRLESHVNDENNEYMNDDSRRYPKRLSKSKGDGTSEKESSPTKQFPVAAIPAQKKRGRKPLTLFKKRIMLQLAKNSQQYGLKRKRGRPKGSKNRKTIKTRREPTRKIYNLRNLSRKEDNNSDQRDLSDLRVLDFEDLENMTLSDRASGEILKLNYGTHRISRQTAATFKEEKEYPPNARREEEQDNYTSSLTNENNGATNSFIEITKIDSNIFPFLGTTYMSSFGTNTLTTTTAHPMVKFPVPVTSTFLSSNENFFSPTSTVNKRTLECNLSSGDSNSSADNTIVPVFIIAPTVTTNTTTAVTTVSALTTTTTSSYSNEERRTHPHGHLASLLDKPNETFVEYGLRLTTGVRRPLIPLAQEQLKTLRENNTCVDEIWARFSVTVVVTAKDMQRSLQPNNIILPVRSTSLPFMSISQSASVQTQTSLNPVPGNHRIASKFAPMSGSAVRVRCPRPPSQVGVRTIPSVKSAKAFEQDSHIVSTRKPRKSKFFKQKSRFNVTTNELSDQSHFIRNEVDDDIRKVVDDLVSYVERREAKDLVILEEPNYNLLSHESSTSSENIITKKKKGPMIRELNRLDVNVIETWDAANKKCTEKHCKLGCVCESLQCCKPAIEEHCGKEECMFGCKCELTNCKRGDGKQHTLLSSLSLLTIPQQNRRILAKEEKEFQQTVIRAKHATIVVGNSGNSRRKREIKLPGRYRDSYVALGKEYGLVDFNVSSDESNDAPRRQTKISAVNNRELILGLVPNKSNPSILRISSEMKPITFKPKQYTKECFVKLRKLDSPMPKNDADVPASSLTLSSVESNPKSNSSVIRKKSRNVAVKSTTLLPNMWYNARCVAARTAPINRKLLKGPVYSVNSEEQLNTFDISRMSVSLIDAAGSSNNPKQQQTPLPTARLPPPPQATLPPSVLLLPLPTQPPPLPPPPPPLSSAIPPPSQQEDECVILSELVFNHCTESFGKIECVTTLSAEQFERGDLSFGVKQFKAKSISPMTSTEIRKISSDRTTKAKSGSNISIDKIANLLNQKIRDLKDGKVKGAFPTGNGESIHLLQWPVLKDLFQCENIQLWYYNGGSKLVITSTKLRPDPKFVNLNDITEQEQKNLPPIITDLLKSNGKKYKPVNRDIYALLHFDGRHVELVGTIFKNGGASDEGNVSIPKNIKLLSDSRSVFSKDKSCLNLFESKSSENDSSSSMSDVVIESVTSGHNLSPMKRFDKIFDITKNSGGSINQTFVRNEGHVSVAKLDDIIVLSEKHAEPIKKAKSSETVTKMGSLNADVLEPVKLSNANLTNTFRLSKVDLSEPLKQSNPDSSEQVKQKQTENEKSPKVGIKSLDSKSDLKKSGSSTNNGQVSLLKNNIGSATRVRKLKTVWQSTKLETSTGENVRVPLPSCATDSRWFVLRLVTTFDVLHIAPKKCSVKQKHIVESIKMATTHLKTVRLPLQISNKKDEECENVNQPKFGIYAVPNISSYVFIGPCGLDEDLRMGKYLTYAGKHIPIREYDDEEQTPDSATKGVGDSQSVVAILKRLCKPSCGKQAVDSWLYTKRNSESESKGTTSPRKDPTTPKKDTPSPKNDNISPRENISSLKKDSVSVKNSSTPPKKVNNCELSSLTKNALKTAFELKLDANSTTDNSDRKETPLILLSKDNGRKTLTKVTCTIFDLKQGKEKIAHQKQEITKEPEKILNMEENSSSGSEIEVGTNMPLTTLEQLANSELLIEQSLGLTDSSGVKRKSEEAAGKKFMAGNKCPFPRSGALDESGASSSASEPQVSKTPVSSLQPSRSQKAFNEKKTMPCPFTKRKATARKSITPAKMSGLLASSKAKEPSPYSGWLVPSFVWFGCLPCEYNENGGLYFPHPVSGVKMTFSNLESTQLWLDRLFQSAILYIPRQLFIKWTLKRKVGNEDVKQFDSAVLNGNYLMTSKGVFDIDKLVATEADSYGLKPIEVLRLQDKKSRRDLELGLFQLQRSMTECGYPDFASKLDLIVKAKEEIESIEKKVRKSDRERKKWKNTKYKALLNLYSKMKGLPIDLKRNIVRKLKTRYDYSDLNDLNDGKDTADGLTFSMSRYCGNTAIFDRKPEDSDLEDYLSEYEEEDNEECLGELKIDVEGESSPIPMSNGSEIIGIVNTNKVSETGIEQNAGIQQNSETDSKIKYEDESVSISLITGSPKQNEAKPVKNTCEIVVTCLRDSRDNNSLCDPILDQNSVVSVLDSSFLNTKPKMDTSPAHLLKPQQITLNTPLITITSPVKATITGNVNNTVPSALNKRKILESSCSSVPEEMSKKLKVQNRKYPYGVHSSGETSLLNSGSENVGVKKYKTIKIDSSITLDNDSASKQQRVLTVSEGAASTNNPTNTVYVNVLSTTQSNILPLRVEDPRKSYSTIRVSSNSPVTKQPIKILPKEVKSVYVQGTSVSRPFLLANQQRPAFVQATQSTLGYPASQHSLPVLNVKKVAKESIPPGVEPRPATILPPPLLPIPDKTQARPLSEQTTQILTTITPLPTLIKIIDGVQIDKGS